MSLFAPRMWRCFSPYLFVSLLEGVCSTHVEMFPPSCTSSAPWLGLLHACGDVSAAPLDSGAMRSFAPRMWRCFSKSWAGLFSIRVCSTHVEMFLVRHHGQPHPSSLLHACGDVSVAENCALSALTFAPRMWRCFKNLQFYEDFGVVCSTHVEMFLRQPRFKRIH